MGSLDDDATGEEVCYTITIHADMLYCASEAQRLAKAAGFDRRRQQETAIVVQELASNILKFARRGTIQLLLLRSPQPGIEILAQDQGPGIPVVEDALQDGYSEGYSVQEDPDRVIGRRGLGLGLGAVQRLTDELIIESRLQGGTRVLARKFLPRAG